MSGREGLAASRLFLEFILILDFEFVELISYEIRGNLYGIECLSVFSDFLVFFVLIMYIHFSYSGIFMRIFCKFGIMSNVKASTYITSRDFEFP